MLGISSSVSLNELHKAKPYGKTGNGRSIYANDKLQKTLNGLQSQTNAGDHKSYHAAAVVNAVNGLRAGTLPANTFLKNGSSNRYCVVHSGFEIEYTIGTPTSQTDIVIVDIRLVEKKVRETKRAGLWSVKKEGLKWQAKTWESGFKAWPQAGDKYENRIKVGINGYCKDIDHAAQMLPSHIARGDGNEVATLESNGYQLFYVPAAGNIFKAGWQSLAQMSKTNNSKNDREAAKILVSYMLDAHERELHVEWTTHRGGSSVLTEAMRILGKADNGKALDLKERQSVFLSDPTSSLAEADNTRRAIKANTKSAKWYNGSVNNIAYAAGAQQFGRATKICSFNAAKSQAKAKRIKGYTVLGGAGAFAMYQLYERAGNVHFSPDQLVAAGWGGLAMALLGALDNIPSLNEDYHSKAYQGAHTLGEKISSKVFG